MSFYVGLERTKAAGTIWPHSAGRKVLSAQNAGTSMVAVYPTACISVLTATIRPLSQLGQSCTIAMST